MTETTNTTTTGNLPALYAALAAAQGEFAPIEKNREVKISMKTGGSYMFRYADLQEVLAKTRPALSKHGLALVQLVQPGAMVCQLMHAEGGVLRSEVPLSSARDLGDPKAFGATISYLRRYLVTAMLGVAADDDLDEDGQEMGAPDNRDHHQPPPVAMPQRKSPVQASQARAQVQQRAEASGNPASKMHVTAGEYKWLENQITAKGLSWEEAYERAGLPYTGEPVTKADFEALRAVL